MNYCQKKEAAHRFDGQGQFDMNKVATWDLLEDKEVIIRRNSTGWLATHRQSTCFSSVPFLAL